MTHPDPQDHVDQLAELHQLAQLVQQLQPTDDHAQAVKDAWDELEAAAGREGARAAAGRYETPIVDRDDTA